MAHPCAKTANEFFKVLGDWQYVLSYSSLADKYPTKTTKRYKREDVKVQNASLIKQETLRPYKKLKLESAKIMGGDHDE